MLRGVVARVDPEEKFGFIVGPTGEEYFFRMPALEGPDFGEMRPGVVVLFDAARDPADEPDDYARAVNIRVAANASPANDNEPVSPDTESG